MPRTPPSRADLELIAALKAQGLQVSAYQLERWRAAGLLPRNRRRGLGRGRGSTSNIDEDALAREATLGRAATLARYAQQGRDMPGNHLLERFARRVPAPESQVRDAFAVELDLLGQALAVEVGTTEDERWQARHAAAAQIARKAGAPFDWQNLVDRILGIPLALGPGVTEARAANQALAHAQAAGSETDLENLIQALAAYGTIADIPNVEQLLVDHKADELAGRTTWANLANAVSLDGLRNILDRTTITDLQHAATIVYTVASLQPYIVLMAMWVTNKSNTGTQDEVAIPVRSVNVDTLHALQAEPMWHSWGRLLPALTGRRRTQHLVVHTLGLLLNPQWLDAAAAYRDRVAALAFPWAASPVGR